jgi:uncharacterized membrane protein YwaF
MKDSLMFSLKIWLTSVILAAIMLNLLFQSRNFMQTLFMWIIGGALCSLPSWFCLLLGILYLHPKSFNIPVKKGILCLWGAFLTVAPFAIIFGLSRSNDFPFEYKDLLCYLSTIILGILIYKFPQPLTDGSSLNTDDAKGEQFPVS